MGRLIRQINTDGSAVSAKYDLLGRLVEHRRHASSAAMVSSGPADPTESLDNALLDTYVTFHYNPKGQMDWAQDAEGAREDYFYDEYGRREAKLDPAGAVLVHEFGPRDNIESETIGTSTGAGTGSGLYSTVLKRTEYVYDSRYRIETKRELWLDSSGNVTGGPGGDGWVTSVAGYDSEDQLISMTDDAGSVTSYQYDNAGREIRVTYPTHGGGDYEEFGLDENGNRVTLTVHEISAGGAVEFSVVSEFDDLDREVLTRRGPGSPIEAVTQQWYDSLGNVIRTLEPRTNSTLPALVGTVMKYDTQGRLVESSDGWQSNFSAPHAIGLITTKKVYSPYGDLVSEVDDNGKSTVYEYDALHRKDKVIYADGTFETVTYRQDDLADQLDAYGASPSPSHLFTIDSVYGIAKRKIEEHYLVHEGPYTGLESKFFGHDDLGRITSATAISGDPINVNKKYMASTERSYDTLGNLEEEVHEFTVAPNGDFQTYSTPGTSVTVDTEWDAFQNPRRIESSVGTDTATGIGPFIVSKGYDAMHRISSVLENRTTGAPISASFEWRGAWNRLESISHHWPGQGGGSFDTVTSFGPYDIRGRLLEQSTESHPSTGSVTIGGRAWVYGPSSVKLLERKLGVSGDDHQYRHDIFNRLTTTTEGDWNLGSGGFASTTKEVDMSFDGVGNIATFDEGPGSGGASYLSFQPTVDDTNAYTSFGSTVVSRDERGNTTEIGLMNLAYDVLGHIVGTIRPFEAPIIATVEVRDAFDRRVYRQQGTEYTYFVCREEELIQEVATDNLGISGSVTHEYVHSDIDALVGQRIDGVPYAYHVDSMGTPYAASDETGDWAERYDIDAYGDYSATTNGASPGLGNRIGLAGAWFNELTNLYYLRARHYSPDLKRFTSRDPLGVWGDSTNFGNPYSYVGNNPTYFSDPTGLGWFSSLKNAVAGAVDGAIGAATFGLVDSTVGASLLGADTSSTAYSATKVVSELAASVAIGAATGGCSTAARALNAASNVAEAYQTANGLIEAGVAASNGDWSGLAQAAAEGLAGAAAGKLLPSPGSAGCFVEGTLVWTPGGPVPIEEIDVGDRVTSTANLLPPEDPGQEERLRAMYGPWVAVDLVLNPATNTYGTMQVRLLRPMEWYEARWGSLFVGAIVPLEIEDMRIADPARVLRVTEVPSPEHGPGKLVLMTTKAVSADVWTMVVEDAVGAETITGTANHPVYSVDRGEFVGLADLSVGECLGCVARSGAFCRETRRAPESLVYNLEVASAHSYLVGLSGVLVHNGYGDAPRGGGSGQTGSYVNTHESGTVYVGKGSESRAAVSGRQIGKEHNDPLVKTEHELASSDRQAFKDEQRKLDQHGGPKSDKNYNKINSPGKAYSEEDGD